MADSKRTRGACAYCEREFTRAGMARHLPTCKARAAAVQAADHGTGTAGPLIHLQVQDAWRGDFWLQLEMNGASSLKTLDGYLRAIWLECCGHMSQFSTGGWGGDQVGMARKAASVFGPGTEIVHTYDFGTSSVTLVRAVAVREGKPTTRHPVALMARNASPMYPCQECGIPATRLCVQCGYEDERPGTLCAVHAEDHPHDEYGEPMPLFNSPRSGMCGYDGPAVAPY
jgi:hypothetical protein